MIIIISLGVDVKDEEIRGIGFYKRISSLIVMIGHHLMIFQHFKITAMKIINHLLCIY